VLFGTVTNGDVAEAIETATKKEIDRRDIVCLRSTAPASTP
jgi:large subunit ribosomal protein L9